ncbi:hypothetical protein ABIA69_002192 [Lysinibacillus parviboronicapiens]|uniref:Laminin G domain-containing protein n=1 Tax=Lysinibacillus parviboronicapiens TaxID=436516 RepID=A0ABV2PJB9_9BACI
MATTEQLMAQYGVAWFGFDESSGNIVDKLGNNYIGTVTGATRVEGWNGEGFAMNFPQQSNIITFNHKVTPIGEKSIKFKIKTSQISEGIIMVNGVSTGYGIDVRIIGGQIRFYIHDAKGWADTLVYVSSQQNVADDKWHDILITFDGTLTKIYIDNSNIYDGIARAKRTESNTITNNLSLNATSTQHFTGELDDLQIYNKALLPSDFTQKRLVVKTTDNRNLVLSPTSARVKEIPNTAEYMMLAQGGIVKEIDSAVDRPPIDFTKSTTEYETVSDINTSLGKGKAFTIPIHTDFKTIKIENNY